jgi:hypothetical protein
MLLFKWYLNNNFDYIISLNKIGRFIKVINKAVFMTRTNLIATLYYILFLCILLFKFYSYLWS